MNQTTIRLEPELKKDFASVCDEMGLSVSTAITIFAKTVVRERRIPFEVTSESNRRLPPDRVVVRSDEELLAKLENAEKGGHMSREEFRERLNLKYGLQLQNY